MRPHARLTDYQYDLPEDRVALHPLPLRDQSRMLVYQDGQMQSMFFYKLPELLPPHALLVQNDTRVVPARLWFYTDNGARIEIFCLSPEKTDPATGLAQHGISTWYCLIGNKKRWKQEELILQLPDGGLTAVYKGEYPEGHKVIFRWQPSDRTFAEVLEAAGKIPLPPYIKRDTDENDPERYQTIFAQNLGSVAAPTASLHFTEGVLQRLDQRGIQRLPLTLHVGAGTFLPVKSEAIADHDMHAETFSISRQTLAALLRHEGPVVAAGTTVCRTLESLCWLGALAAAGRLHRVYLDQWDAYDLQPMLPREALEALIRYLDDNGADRLTGQTRLLIAPGYQWQMVDALITNFHQPGSTLLLLVASFVGSQWKDLYDYAMAHDYRFLSYGDSSLLWRNRE